MLCVELKEDIRDRMGVGDIHFLEEREYKSQYKGGYLCVVQCLVQ